MSKHTYHTLFKLTLLVAIGTGLTMCRNELPTPSSDNPDFFVDALVNGNKRDIQAGNDAVLMRPFYEKDTLNIITYGSFIGNLNCDKGEACANSFELHIRQKESQSSGQGDITKDITAGELGVRGPATKVFNTYKATFTSKALPLGVNHTWYFGDGNQSTDLNPVHYYTNEADSVVEPLLTISNSSNGCSSSIQYEVDFTMDCSTDIVYTNTVPIGSIAAYPLGSSDLWDFGNGLLPISASNPIPSDSLFKACVSSTSTSGCEAYKCENIVRDSTVVPCVANFDVEKQTLTLDDERNFGEITLFHTVESGKRYSSKLFTQPADSYFEIVKVEDYQPDTQGNATKRIEVRFSLTLYGDSETDQIRVQSESSYFCVSYP